MAPARRRAAWFGPGLLLALMLSTPGAAAAPGQVGPEAAPPAFSAAYAVRKAGLTLGRAELELRRPAPGRYFYRLHTRPTGLFRLVEPAEVEETSIGRIGPAGFRPDIYRYRRRGDDKAREAELRFDWNALEVLNDVADWPWRMAITRDTIDRVISPLQLMHDMSRQPASRGQLVYRIADGGELRTYVLDIEAEARVTTPLGTFETLRVRRQDTDSDRETILWLAPALRYLAVQVEQWEGGSRNFRLLIDALDGLAPVPAGGADA